MNQAQLQKMMKQAQQMQKQVENAQSELAAKEYSATAGGGAVEITMTGAKEVLKVNIKQEVIDPEDKEMLEEMVAIAITTVLKDIETEQESALGSITGGLPF